MYLNTRLHVPMSRYDPHTNRWSPVAPMNTKRKHLGVSTLDGMVYAIGGRDDSTELNSVERYVRSSARDCIFMVSPPL